jgi:transposase
VGKKLQNDLTASHVIAAARDRPIRLMFQDEARFGRIDNPRRCWAPAPMRPTVNCSIVREYTYAYAAASPIDGTLDSLVLPEASTAAMNLFLAEVSARHPDELIVMVLDGAGWHRANNLNTPENIRFHFLPPYSPELNPVEHLWDELREKGFHNRVFSSLDAVEDQLVDRLAAMEHTPALVKSITGWPWITDLNLNAK